MKPQIIVTFDDRGFPTATLKNTDRDQIMTASNFLNKIARKPEISETKKSSKLSKFFKSVNRHLSSKPTELRYQSK